MDPTQSFYSLAVDWFANFEDYLRVSNPSKAEVLQHLETSLFYIDSLINAETTEYSITLYQIRQNLWRLKTKLQDVPPPPLQQPITTSNPKQKKLSEGIENVKTKPNCSGLKDIAGYGDVKKLLKTVIILPKKQPQLYAKQKVSKTVLLFGPPGTGKTQLAHAVAGEIDADIYCVTSSTIISPMMGETEKTIEVLFNKMKNATKSTVLFIDEIDGICRARHETESDHTRRLKTELMCHLSRFDDNQLAYLICATNCPWDLDTAFLRRFHNRIYVPLPTKQERIELLQFFTRNTPLQNTFLFWDPLLDMTEGYSCSDLEDLVQKAMLQPIVELEGVHVWKRVDEKYVPWYNNQFTENLRFCTIDELPEGSVNARDVTLDDLLKATNLIQRTVSLEEEEKFGKYMEK